MISTSDVNTDGFQQDYISRAPHEQHDLLAQFALRGRPDLREHLLDQAIYARPTGHSDNLSTALHKHNKNWAPQ